jgi:hypothetical protein
VTYEKFARHTSNLKLTLKVKKSLRQRRKCKSRRHDLSHKISHLFIIKIIFFYYFLNKKKLKTPESVHESVSVEYAIGISSFPLLRKFKRKKVIFH